MLKRLIAVIASILLLCSLYSSTALAAQQAGTFYTLTADPITLDGWKNLFGKNVLTTANVGTVWTDKSVSIGVPDTNTYPEFTKIQMNDSTDNFLITLSALSATKSIIGHKTLPTDTVFVLDLSSSMYRITVDETSYKYSTYVVSKMVNAVNDAIHTLLELNPLNRVGVVVYYGAPNLDPQSDASHCKKLLALNNYQPLNGSTHSYLVPQIESITYTIKVDDVDREVTEKNALTGIQVNNALYVRGTNTLAKNSSEPYVMPGTKNADNIAGTYMQLGIEAARDMFLAANTTIPETEDFQAGATRIPILVLMSDGEPTAADNAFYDVGDADMGNNTVGERSAAETDFLTQLTAAYTRKKIDEHYLETTPLIYTLGLETNSISYDVMDPKTTDLKYANNKADHSIYFYRTGRAVEGYEKDKGNMHPSYQNSSEVVNAKIHHYWQQLINSSNSGIKISYLDALSSWKTSYDNWEVKKITVKKHDGFPSSIDQKYYVDQYFSANTADDLTSAFNSLVEEIILQSAYYPTYVENGAIGMSGYLEFHDEIGDMLEVKQVHGLARKATASEQQKYNLSYFYYTGKQLAKHVHDCLDDATQRAELKVVLGKLLKARFKLTDEQTLQTAVDAIIDPNNRMFYYNSEDDYNNCIRWYANANEQYIALDTLTRTAAPPGAKFKMESYWYADTTSPAAMENYNSIIRVKTDLTTGKQWVTWSVPASMIPLVRYEVTLENKSLANTGDITVKYTGNYPMRAVFEVGLNSDIDRYNAVEYLTKAKYPVDKDGKYTFYSNKWTESFSNPSSLNIDDVDNTLSYFRPSEQNERYNITADTLLYKKVGDNNYQPWTGSKPTLNDDVYVAIPTFTVNSEADWGVSGQASLTNAYLLLTSNFEESDITGSSGAYYISRGTATYPQYQSINKTENITGTAEYSFYETTRDETNVTSILGNNGTFSFIPDTGMTITKAAIEGDTCNPTFTFVITPQAGQTLGSYTVTTLSNAAKALQQGTTQTITASNNTLTVSVHPGETVYIPGLPIGSYTVEEQVYGTDGTYHYEVSQVTITDPDGVSVDSTTALNTVTIQNRKMIEVVYTNRIVTTGSVRIEKSTTTNVAGIDLSAADHAFTFEVALGADNQNKAYSLTYADGHTASMTTNEEGKLSLSLRAGEHAIISGIAPNTSVTVTEIIDDSAPKGYAVQGDAARSQTVTEGNTALFSYVNVYTPDKAPVNIQLKGVKTLGRDWITTDSFSFQLQHEESAGNWVNVGSAAIVDAASASKEFDLSAALQGFAFTAPGTYNFRVVEVIPADEDKLPGVTYDAAADSFTVVITDADVDGTLEISSVTSAEGTTVTTSSEADTTIHLVETAFTNTYAAQGTSVTFSGTKTMAGRLLQAGEFSFELHETGSDYAVAADAVALETVTYGTDGHFAFQPIPYNTKGTHYYVVREIGEQPGVTNAPEYRLTVTVTDNYATGMLDAVITGAPSAAELNFENRYDATDNAVILSGTKTLSGRPLAQGEFSFSLYASNEQFEVGEKLQTVQNVGSAYAFSQLDFDAAGVYHYLVMEDAGSAPGVTYDDTVYRVVITVTDNTADGVLEVSPTVTIAPKAGTDEAALLADITPLPVTGLDFTNSYDAADTSIRFSGTKSLYGRSMREAEFSFTLYAADQDYAILHELETVANAWNGEFKFRHQHYSAAGDYYYVVKEQAGSLSAMTYDPTEYRIHVSVIDVNAQLVARATEVSGASFNALNFQNFYDAADAILRFSGTKTLLGRPLDQGEFSFTLYGADTTFRAGAAIETVTNRADGSFTFSPIVYNRTGTYCYIVRENATPASYITSDAAEYQIQVDVWNNDGVLVAECTTFRMADGERTQVNTNSLSFTNHYIPSSVSVPLSGMKHYEGAALTEGLFTFHLYEADDMFTPAATPLESVTHAADGSFTFTPRTFSSAGVYRFVVVEDASLPMANVTYDPTVYHVTVTVTDDGLGSLAATTSLSTSDGFAAERLVFENFFFKVPATGDHSSMEAYLALGLVSMVGMFGLMLHMRRSHRRNH